jgi:RimJ/RimL family protein N-acetyltransferase
VAPTLNEHGQPVGEPVPDWSPRARPRPGPFTGRYCSVVPLHPDHAEDLFPTCSGPDSGPLWTYLSASGPFADVSGLREHLASTVADPEAVSVAVLSPDGRALGFASYLRIDPAQGSVEIGSILFGSDLQRTSAATEAMCLLARHVFDDLGYRRYEWKCDSLNAPSRSAALRLGFRYEGLFRQAVVTKGRNRDTAWFAIIDADWPALATAYTTWLDSDNFDPDGRQRRALSTLTQPDTGTGVPHLGTRGRLA